ncbi:glycosyltransferase [Phosphitispora sp. TUW77]|uniref:glycosyltransferase n=1 Tax=Phosphitispora sp. TUW77 TaxID=3152361 RepID=UPI003AB56CE7
MKKIYFLTGNLGYGGATKILVQLSNYLSNNNQIVKIINYGTKDTFYQINPQINIININGQFTNIPKIRRLFQLILLRGIIMQEKPDVIIAFENMAKLLAVSAAIFSKTKVIISERKDPYNYNNKKKRYMHLRYLISDGCVFQTVGASKYFPHSVQKKGTIIPNFITIEKKEKLPIELRKNEIAFVARFELEQKRQDVMVKAFKLIVKKHPDIKLVFYGDGPDIDIVKTMVSEYGISDSVIFAGVVSNMDNVFRHSRLFVLTSDYEGIPNALVEAMAYGLPVVATDCSPGGARLLINSGVNGIIVPINDFSRLAKAIIYLLDNPQIAESFGAKAQQVVDTFKPSKILPMWQDYINKII